MRATLIRNLDESVPFSQWWLYLAEEELSITAAQAANGLYYVLATSLYPIQQYAGCGLSLASWLALTHERRTNVTIELDDAIVAFAREHTLYSRIEFHDAVALLGEAQYERKSEGELIDQFALFDTRSIEERQREHNYALMVANAIASAVA